MNAIAHRTAPHLAQAPLYLWIDPTDHCNLSCSFCYTKHSHGQRHMSPELLSRVLDKLDPVRSRIQVAHLNWRGEPLMNPQFERLLEVYMARWADVPMHWHTNGLLLTRKRARRIIAASQPHRLFVSIDGGTRELHEKNRGEDTFRPALEGLRNLLDENGSDGPLQIGLYQIDWGAPEAEYDEEFLELARRVREWVRVPALGEDGEEPAGSTSTHACFWAGHALCIDPQGKVSICLLARGERSVIGHLIEDSLESILTRAMQWRLTLATQGRRAMPQCRDCRKRDGSPFVQLEQHGG